MSLGLALLVLCQVGVLSLRLERHIHGVVVGVLHKSTATAIVAVLDGAVNELLLRKQDLLSVFDLVGALNRASGREGPA